MTSFKFSAMLKARSSIKKKNPALSLKPCIQTATILSEGGNIIHITSEHIITTTASEHVQM